jgi:hypothetical protein
MCPVVVVPQQLFRNKELAEALLFRSLFGTLYAEAENHFPALFNCVTKM